jgi:hypothetical protein
MTVRDNQRTRKSYVTHYTGLDDYPARWIPQDEKASTGGDHGLSLEQAGGKIAELAGPFRGAGAQRVAIRPVTCESAITGARTGPAKRTNLLEHAALFADRSYIRPDRQTPGQHVVAHEATMN